MSKTYHRLAEMTIECTVHMRKFISLQCAQSILIHVKTMKIIHIRTNKNTSKSCFFGKKIEDHTSFFLLPMNGILKN